MTPDLTQVSIEVSARHVHLSQADQDILFGAGYELPIAKELSQPGQWAGEDKIIVRGPKGEFDCRVLGPCRSATQVELAKTDCLKIGVEPALRISGDHDGTPGCTLVGPQGQIELKSGVIVARRHIHLSDAQAVERGLKNGDLVSVRVGGDRGVTFHEVAIRSNPEFDLHLHLDTDEGNAAWLEMGGGIGEII
ncbi:TPA: propanediol utilization protein [Candidatus Uhrbacteria bacterium]|nr:propanediol utilization protein [Candidatus Uhrbacteria bacterium]